MIEGRGGMTACARYFGFDGTLCSTCSTHNGRFLSDTSMRCDRVDTPDPRPVSQPVAHEWEPGRDAQSNRWFGADTCECRCGCGFLALGQDIFNRPLCSHCEANEQGWNPNAD